MVNFSPNKVFETKEEYVYEMLRTAILKCELKPGEKLVMDRLKGDLGTSPIPIRAALHRLEIEGLVKITPHSSAVVAPISLHEITEIFTLLETLERAAFLLAAECITDEDYQNLDELVTRMDGAVQIQNARLWSELNTQFHRLIAEISGMQLLTEFTDRIVVQWIRLSRCYFAQIDLLHIEQAQREHHQILACLWHSDVETLAEIAITHNRLALEAYQELIATGQISEGVGK